MLKKLDPIIHSELRLAIMSLLISVNRADFKYLKEETESTAGNLSVQLTKLEEAGYIKVEKGFKGKMPQTTCSITKMGIEAFEKYVEDLKSYLKM
ncbi:MAG TPA: transcriptional regulator [Bacteroidales bacterium]|jgi:DNA-binding HxlR family transcriptional regulator|nr:transcriptional regulator [Bacteroidales bacterium]